MNKVKKLENKLFDFINMFGLEQSEQSQENYDECKKYLFLRSGYDDENKNYPKMITRDIGYMEKSHKEEYLISVQVTINNFKE